LTADYDKKNAFDIEAFLNHKMRLKKKDVYDVVQMD
jgi:type IV secretion system protein VirD4